jgi:hypothetical protein
MSSGGQPARGRTTSRKTIAPMMASSETNSAHRSAELTADGSFCTTTAFARGRMRCTTAVSAGDATGGATVGSDLGGKLRVNAKRPLLAWPSAAAVRQDTVYLPLGKFGGTSRLISIALASSDGWPSTMAAPLESSSWTTVNFGSGRSENQSEIFPGCAASVASAAGSLRRSFAWASRSAGVSPTAIAASPSAIGCRRRDKGRSCTLENGATHTVGANAPSRKAH